MSLTDTRRVDLGRGRRIEADEHQEHERLYDGHPHKYVGGFVADLQAGRAQISQLVGAGFWETIAAHTEVLAELLGVEAISAYMVPAHVRAARLALAGRVRITVLREATVAGRRMQEILIERVAEAGRGR